MSSWGCPHEANGVCQRVSKLPCDPGMSELGIAFDLALGYAVAHEVCHCLLGPGHALAGLMRATWTRNDAQQMARLSLGLSRPEALRAAARAGSR